MMSSRLIKNRFISPPPSSALFLLMAITFLLYSCGDNPFLVPTTSSTVLTVSKAGTGTGTVTSSPSGINCGTTCNASFTQNGDVTLTATADNKSVFTGWTGSGCSGTDTCLLTLTSDMAVTATFDTNATSSAVLTISKTGTGTGTVTSSPSGINCGPTCDASLTQNTEVILTAVADANLVFVSWTGGGCSGKDPCSLTLTSDTTVTATFATNTTPVVIDSKQIPVGDGKLLTTVPTEVGYLYVCYIPDSPNLPGKAPWINTTTGTWDQTIKPSVRGSVAWPFNFAVNGPTHYVSGNGLPKHRTGTFGIAITDPVYKYDKNPNTIAAEPIAWQLPLAPVVASSPTCTHGGAIGVLLSGARIFNASDADGRDAVAHEVQDACDGHPQSKSIYHYHNLTRCSDQTDIAGQHSPLVGYVADGFGLFGNQGEKGVALTNADLDICHGHTHAIALDGGLPADSYHYHATKEFPYTVGCFRGTPAVGIH